jgi:DNA-binding MarR family transcriptional regulator
MADRSDPSVSPLDEREMAAWHALIRAHSRVVRKLEAELEAEQGLTLPAYEVLAHLSEAPDQRLRMSELAAHAVLTPSGLTRLIDKLAREGLVRRDKCDADARVVYAVLTEVGLQRLQSAYPTHLRGVRQHLIDWLSQEQLEGLAGALGELANGCKTACTEAEVAAAEELEAQCAEKLDAHQLEADQLDAKQLDAKEQTAAAVPSRS